MSNDNYHHDLPVHVLQAHYGIGYHDAAIELGLRDPIGSTHAARLAIFQDTLDRLACYKGTAGYPSGKACDEALTNGAGLAADQVRAQRSDGVIRR